MTRTEVPTETGDRKLGTRQDWNLNPTKKVDEGNHRSTEQGQEPVSWQAGDRDHEKGTGAEERQTGQGYRYMMCLRELRH